MVLAVLLAVIVEAESDLDVVGSLVRRVWATESCSDGGVLHEVV